MGLCRTHSFPARRRALMTPTTYLQRLRVETEDRLRHHPAVRNLLYRYRLWSDRPAEGPQEQARAIARLCAAARLAEGTAAEPTIKRRIVERVGRLDVDRVDWTEFVP